MARVKAFREELVRNRSKNSVRNYSNALKMIPFWELQYLVFSLSLLEAIQSFVHIILESTDILF